MLLLCVSSVKVNGECVFYFFIKLLQNLKYLSLINRFFLKVWMDEKLLSNIVIRNILNIIKFKISHFIYICICICMFVYIMIFLFHS